jgi:hypothetical protein
MLITGEMNAIPAGATKGSSCLVDFHQISMRGTL